MTHAELAALIQEHVNGAIAANNQAMQNNQGGSPYSVLFLRNSKVMVPLGILINYSFCSLVSTLWSQVRDSIRTRPS